MILEICHVPWVWYSYHVVLKNFLFLAKLARDKMSQRLKLVFKCFSKIKTRALTQTRTSKANYCQKAVKLLTTWWATLHSSFQLPGCLKRFPQNLGKQYHRSLLCQKWLLQIWSPGGLEVGTHPGNAFFWNCHSLKVSTHTEATFRDGFLLSLDLMLLKLLRWLSQGSSEELGHPPNPGWS